MPYSLPLPESLRQQGWKVKIRDKERVEEPHVTVIRGKVWWRFGLRSRQFLDAHPDPRLVPNEVVDEILAATDVLCEEWDDAYPENPVLSEQEEAEDEDDDED
jgi:hypothetical protein